LPDVQVRGVLRVEEAARQFAERVAAPPPGVEGLAVWDRPLCLEIDNLSPDTTRALRDRIGERARAVGLGWAPDGCQANVIVVATSQGAATARGLVEDNPVAFRPADRFTQLDGHALRRFMDSDAPVRWWTVSLPVNEFTRKPLVALRGSGPGSGLMTGRLHFGEDAHYVMASVVVVIDAAKTGEVPISTLADYIAFTILAQVDDTADYTGQPTILNLFQPGDSPDELTAWDVAYLRALYEAPLRWSGLSRRQRDIARHMATPTPASTPDASPR
jgi:hypothetical protein